MCSRTLRMFTAYHFPRHHIPPMLFKLQSSPYTIQNASKLPDYVILHRSMVRSLAIVTDFCLTATTSSFPTTYDSHIIRDHVILSIARSHWAGHIVLFLLTATTSSFPPAYDSTQEGMLFYRRNRLSLVPHCKRHACMSHVILVTAR